MAKKIIFMAVCLGFALSLSYGQDKPVRGIVDDSALRARARDTWLTADPGRVLANSPAMFNLDGGGRVHLRVEAAQDEFMVIFARELTAGFVSSAVPGTNTGRFPGWAQGSWILTRRRDTGAATRIRVFLRSDPYVYVQFRPFTAERCQMDVVLYDAYIVRSLPLPVSFERLYTLPMNEVLNFAGDAFPRRYFDPNPDDYRSQRQFVAQVRERLPQLRFTDDGAIDSTGRYVYIETGLEQQGQPGLNCSGFIKWLIDGMLRPVTGERLAIDQLKAPFGDRGSLFTSIWEDQRAPFFGLDWIRNLASQAWIRLRSPAFGRLTEIEVRSQPFSQMFLRGRNLTSLHTYPGFLENAGYGIEGILPLLYTLAIDEPGRLYLAAINNEQGPADPRGPRIRQYFHVLALIPYFNEQGIFQVTVFESAEETSISAVRNRYPHQERIVNGERRVLPNGHYINLVRVPIETAFDP
ncbi:MAG: hypothetical protein FWG89_05575 [Treponema sp.]|nr:hypothetical protein [Treponema sp.]